MLLSLWREEYYSELLSSLEFDLKKRDSEFAFFSEQ